MRRIDRSTRTYKAGYLIGFALGVTLAAAALLGLIWCCITISHALIGL